MVDQTAKAAEFDVDTNELDGGCLSDQLDMFQNGGR